MASVMIVQANRCTGCGDCIAVCPGSAIRLSVKVAIIDQARCTGCEACLTACSKGAIAAVEESVAVPVPQPARNLIAVRLPSQLAPWLARACPVMGAALAFAGRELVPRVATYLVGALDRQMAQESPSASLMPGIARNGGRLQRRQHGR
jgi:Fe-S-cluster-containing hydrogenase component 2